MKDEAVIEALVAAVAERVAQRVVALLRAQPEMATELVDAKALARLTNLPVSAIYEYARAGKIPCARLGKHVRFSPPEVIEALRKSSSVG